MVRRRSHTTATPPDRSALLQERAKLLARLAEIDRALGNRRETAVTTPPERRRV